jgi:hypothetical protein
MNIQTIAHQDKLPLFCPSLFAVGLLPNLILSQLQAPPVVHGKLFKYFFLLFWGQGRLWGSLIIFSLGTPLSIWNLFLLTNAWPGGNSLWNSLLLNLQHAKDHTNHICFWNLYTCLHFPLSYHIPSNLNPELQGSASQEHTLLLSVHLIMSATTNIHSYNGCYYFLPGIIPNTFQAYSLE